MLSILDQRASVHKIDVTSKLMVKTKEGYLKPEYVAWKIIA